MEREQEREEFIKEINKMQDFVREKEKIQSSETQLTKEVKLNVFAKIKSIIKFLFAF